jgi:hypothetical protein
VAQCVLVDLYDNADCLRSLQVQRDTMRDVRESARYYTLDLTRQSLLQAAAYLASETWERDQECAVPTLHPVYHPTAMDMLVRYIKTLSWWGMERRVAYAAAAIGCSLYTYQPHEIGEVVYWAAPNIRRVQKRGCQDICVTLLHGHPVSKENHELIERGFPVADRLRPLFRYMV